MRLPFLAALLLGCHAPALHQALEAPRSPLPASLQSCAVLDDVQDGKRCRLYDLQARAFAAAPDPLLQRVLRYERWQDKLHTVEHQLAPVRIFTEPMAPGDPEARFADERFLKGYGAMDDSASYDEEAGLAAAFRCASTGTPADCARLEDVIRGSLGRFEATGIDGYLARQHFAGVPAGTPARNGLSLQVREEGEQAGIYDIPASAVARFPAYYSAGLEGPGGSHIPARPSWQGHPSIDSSIGPLNSWPVAFGLLKDPDLKARLARQYGCFLKRLRIVRITHLAQNAELQREIAGFLAQGVVHLAPDDPDLAKADEIWGFYLPQFNWRNAATYPRECPATLATDAAPEEIIDVTRPGFDGKLLAFFQRMSGGDEQADGIDFTYFASLRGGDAALLLSHATAAALLTGDGSFLRWRDEILVAKANARAVARTEGAFSAPIACRSYFRVPAVYSAVFGRLLIEGDAGERAYWEDLWRRKLAGRELSDVADHLFEVMGGAALGDRGAALDLGLGELAGFGGTAGRLDDPRRNDRLDFASAPPPGFPALSPPAADVRFCQEGVTVFGLHIPGDPVDPAYRYTDRALPMMLRQDAQWLWGRDPFQLNAVPDAEPPGARQYTGVDLSEPYWIARHAGLFPDPHQVLAWGPP